VTPSPPELILSHWAVSWPLTVDGAVAAGLYLWGVRRAGGLRAWSPWRVLAFTAGIGSILVALESGLDTEDTRLLSVHMEQHLVLLQIAPVLLLAGQPARLALRVLPPAGRRSLGRTLVALRPYTGWATGLVVYAVVILGTHVPAFYDATLTHPLLHDFEHALYLFAGLLFWWPVIGGDPAPRRRLNGSLALVYVTAGMLPMTGIGVWLSSDPTLVYRAYALPARSFGISAVVDQQHAGAIMWVAGGVIASIAGLWAALRTLVEEERRQRLRDLHAARLNEVRT
jgi:putative membrane protein